MLETLREYGLERVYEGGDADEVRSRHAAYLGRFVSAQERDFLSLRQLEAFDMVEEEMDNVRQALSWSMDAEGEVALQLTADLGWYWNERCHWQEAREWQTRCWERYQGTRSNAMAWMLARKSFINAQYGEGEVAKREAEDALRMATDVGDLRCVAWSQMSLGYVHIMAFRDVPFASRCGVAAGHYRSALRAFRAADDRSGVASALLFLSITAEGPEAYGLLDEASRATREFGPPMVDSAVAYARGGEVYRAGDHRLAEELLREAVAVAREVGSLSHEGYALNWLASLHEEMGDYVSAHGYWTSRAGIESRLGRPAAGCLRRAAACCRKLGRMRAARGHLEDAVRSHAGSRDDDAIDAVWAFLSLADLDLREAAMEAARERLLRATALASGLAAECEVRACVDTAGRLLCAHDERERGVRLLGAGSARRGGEDPDDPLDVDNIVAASARATEAEAREWLGEERFSALHDEGKAMALEDAFAEVREYLGTAEPVAAEPASSEGSVP